MGKRGTFGEIEAHLSQEVDTLESSTLPADSTYWTRAVREFGLRNLVVDGKLVGSVMACETSSIKPFIQASYLDERMADIEDAAFPLSDKGFHGAVRFVEKLAGIEVPQDL